MLKRLFYKSSAFCLIYIFKFPPEWLIWTDWWNLIFYCYKSSNIEFSNKKKKSYRYSKESNMTVDITEISCRCIKKSTSCNICWLAVRQPNVGVLSSSIEVLVLHLLMCPWSNTTDQMAELTLQDLPANVLIIWHRCIYSTYPAKILGLCTLSIQVKEPCYSTI